MLEPGFMINCKLHCEDGLAVGSRNMKDRGSELDIFAAAIELPADERDVYLDSACQGDDSLRARLETLISVDKQAEQSDFLNPAAINVKQALQLQRHHPSLVGRDIGAFRIVEKIGSGGMGEMLWQRRARSSHTSGLFSTSKSGVNDAHEPAITI